MKQKLLLVAAVFFGLLAFVLTYQQIDMERRKALGAAEFKSLIIIHKPMARGEIIKAADIELVQERRFKQQNYREIPWEQRGTIIGRTLDVNTERNHILLWSDLKPASSRKEGLNSIVPMGYRAISISVDTVSSVSGLIRPGNNVDIIGTFRFPDMKGDQSLDTITLTILQNVNILATGTDMVRANESDVRGGPIRKSYSTVTLSLKPKEVEMIIFASQKGKLSLSLRNFEETKVETELQSVNFRYLEQNLQKYNKERAGQMHYIE